MANGGDTHHRGKRGVRGVAFAKEVGEERRREENRRGESGIETETMLGRDPPYRHTIWKNGEKAGDIALMT